MSFWLTLLLNTSVVTPAATPPVALPPASNTAAADCDGKDKTVKALENSVQPKAAEQNEKEKAQALEKLGLTGEQPKPKTAEGSLGALSTMETCK